jgi:hypothetical protein
LIEVENFTAFQSMRVICQAKNKFDDSNTVGL